MLAVSANSTPFGATPLPTDTTSVRNSGRTNSAPSKPMSDGLPTTAAHEQTHCQNAPTAWPLMRQSCVLPPSWTKNFASISVRDITSRNCEWLPSSVKSFGAGVAVQASLNGTAAKPSMICVRRLPS